MRFGIACRVDSYTEIGKEPIQVTVDGIDFTLVPSENGLIKELTAVVSIDNHKGFTSYVSSSNGLTVDHDHQIYKDLIDMVQYIEASLSFLLGVKKVYWEEPEELFIPENEEEQEKFNVTRFSIKHHYPGPEQNIKLTAGDFKQIIQQRSKYESFKMVKLFHRDGIKEFESFRYIQAYYNFYFVLEDLYGKGKTQNRDIEQKFKSNQKLRDIIQNLKIPEHHYKSIQQFLMEENKNFDIDGVIELIIRIRGNLHHFSSKSTKRIGTPLNQRDFECMAFLLMGISTISIIQATFE